MLSLNNLQNSLFYFTRVLPIDSLSKLESAFLFHYVETMKLRDGYSCRIFDNENVVQQYNNAIYNKLAGPARFTGLS